MYSPTQPHARPFALHCIAAGCCLLETTEPDVGISPSTSRLQQVAAALLLLLLLLLRN
jgi:hypothetical protein